MLSLAVCAVGCPQGAAMRRFGAGAAYACWWLVPAAMAAVALPHPSDYPLAIHIDVAAQAAQAPAPRDAADARKPSVTEATQRVQGAL